jgi:hypothetical protein
MATVSERARELAEKIMSVQCNCDSVICALADIRDFEQALLAERRLARKSYFSTLTAFWSIATRSGIAVHVRRLRIKSAWPR